MAKALLSIRKKKTNRKTKSEAYLINRKYLGDEPEFKAGVAIDEGTIAKALNWYTYMCDKNDAREYIKDYLQSQNRNKDIKELTKVSDKALPLTAAWIARILMRGAVLAPSSKEFFEFKLKESFEKHFDDENSDIVEQPEKNVSKPSIQARIGEKAYDIIGDIEELIDSGEQFSLYDYLVKNEIPAIYTSKIIEYYTPWLKELVEALNGKDEQLKEAYRHMSKKQIKDRLEFFGNMLEDANRYGSNTKKVNKIRKPRTISNEKKLKYFRYQKEDGNFKIASVNPEKIIGAQELWTFNTKYKTLTVFRAIDRGGLQVKRTSIIGYDEKTSVTKRTGRKPEEYIEKVLNGGKLVLRKVMDELKSTAPLAERINENTILLKVVS